MKRFASPFDLWALWMQGAIVVAEAQAVIAMRVWGMAGLWSVTPYEATRTWTEKPGAFVQSAGRATEAMLAGKRPDQVAKAALAPVRRKTRSNVRRLAKRGPAR